MPRIVDHDAQRERVLEAAWAAFSTQGYDGVSMRSLAAGLGVSTGSLYHYFQDKEEILRVMLPWAARRDAGRAAVNVRGVSAPDRLDVLLAWMEAHEAPLARTVMLTFEVKRVMAPDVAGPLIAEALATWKHALGALLGLDPPGAALVLSMALGVLVHRELDPDGPGPAAHRALLSPLMGAATGA